jgi:hypothetical protein
MSQETTKAMAEAMASGDLMDAKGDGIQDDIA